MYASWYMRGEEGYSRFFAYTQPVHRQHGSSGACRQHAADVPAGEGVGLCSYLLIGFYYRSEDWARSGNESVRRDPCG